MPRSAPGPPVCASDADRVALWVRDRCASHIWESKNGTALALHNPEAVAPPQSQNGRHYGLGTGLERDARFPIQTCIYMANCLSPFWAGLQNRREWKGTVRRVSLGATAARGPPCVSLQRDTSPAHVAGIGSCSTRSGVCMFVGG